MKKEIYDVIVIGAGPAGSTASKAAADQGLKVLMLDKEVFPRDKACGGYLSFKTIKLLGEDLPVSIIQRKIYGVRLYGQNDYFISKESLQMLGCIVRRQDFDCYLVDKAVKAGVQFIDGCEVKGIKIDINNYCVEVYAGNQSYISKRAISAEGVNSFILRNIGYQRERRRWQYGFALAGSIECSPVCSDDKYVELYCIPFLGGFGWVFPLRDTYNIGVGCWACLSHKLYDYYFDFAENILKNKNIKGIVSKPQGSFIPVGGLLRNLGNDYIIAAGDSGGFVDAFSGEGIYYAIKSGQIAAGEIVKSLSDNEYPLYLQYKRECGREFNKSF